MTSFGSDLGIPSATLSFHLKELKSAGLVRCERRARSRIYSSDLAAIKQLVNFLTANCCEGIGGIETGDTCCDAEDVANAENAR